MLDRNFFFTIGPKIVACFRKKIFMEGKDIDGNSFPAYSPMYAIAKASNKFKRQASEFKNKNTPVLTGDLMRDWTMRKQSSSGFTFGTMSHGGKVKSLEAKGRVITKSDKPIPDDCNDLLMREANKYTKKKLNKQFKKTTTIKIKAGN